MNDGCRIQYSASAAAAFSIMLFRIGNAGISSDMKGMNSVML